MGNRLPVEDWLDQAERLSPGASIKVPHKGCTQSNSLWLHHKEDGFSAYCFKCHRKGWKSHGPGTMRDYLNRKAAIQARQEELQHRGTDLPADFSHTLPEPARVWLAKSGLRPSLWHVHGVGWSEKFQRVILPVHDGHEYIGWTARGVFKNQTPKYVERIQHGKVPYIPARSGAVHVTAEEDSSLSDDPHAPSLANSGLVGARSTELPDPLRSGGRRRAVVTEDLISGIVVACAGDSYPLLGTSGGPALLSRLIQYQRVNLWLDPDKAGQFGTTSLLKSLRALVDVRIITSLKDPKYYSEREIKEKLS